MKSKLKKIEMMRGAAALYVLITHLLPRYMGSGWDGLLGFPMRFGTEAVMLFFLISGFVVFYSTEKQRPDFPAYLGRRWLRIYPIFILALGLGAVEIVVIRGQSLKVEVLIGNLFMLQDVAFVKPGVWFPAFGGNMPLWSLSYEWWFYMMFYPIWRYVEPHRQRHVAAVISLTGLIFYALHPNQICLYLAYFILWWTGVEFARQFLAEGQVTLRGQRASLLVLSAFVFLVAALLLARRDWSGSFVAGAYPILQIRHFAACLAFALGALLWQHLKWRWFEAVFGPFILLAPMSYGIYVLHCPIAVHNSLFNYLPFPWALPIGLMAVFVVAWFAEVPLQNFIKKSMSSILPKGIIPPLTVVTSPGTPELEVGK